MKEPLEMITRLWVCTTLIIISIVAQNVTADLCNILGGRTELILDVTESVGNEFNQTVEPNPLPVEGDPSTEIQLHLSDKGKEKFVLHDNSLSLNKPLDRDADGQSTLLFEITCEIRATSLRRNIPVVVRIHDLNDNSPLFIGAPYEVALREDATVKSPIFKGIRAEDADSRRNGQVEYRIKGINPSTDLFSIRFPHQGVLFLEAPLDYEKSPVYYLTIEATDLSTNEHERRKSTTTLTVRIEDIDDQDPVFDTASIPAACPANLSACVPEYRSSITEGKISGVLDIYPGRIRAKDLDSLGATILYSFEDGSPLDYRQYFSMDSRTAVITQKIPVDRSIVKNFEIVIQAMERTSRRGKATAKLHINVEDVDTSPPKVVIPSFSGIVPESSKPGTPVIRDDRSGLPFKFSVTDFDISAGEIAPKYIFELTTSAFVVSPEGILVVALPNLDRDPPSLADYTFQVIAREDKDGGAASAPVSITVRLLDINDNPPRLPVLPTVRVAAGSNRRKILTLQATDADKGVNAIVRYELVTGEMNHFSINPTSGELFAYGELLAGEEYLLNIKVTDTGDLSTEGFVKVLVSRGPNKSGPLFTRTQYSATIPEDIPHGGHVTTVQATDPDGDSTYFSISEGNEEKSFEIDTISGSIIVVAPLNRETKDNYKLVITAEDSERKNNTADVFVKITDVNDEVPHFVGEPFSFRVDEGLPNASVGIVKAEDKDLKKSGEVVYTLEGKDELFKINTLTGEIFTKTSLDYEKEQVHYLSVIARDKATDPQSSTTTVTILVNDVSDETPRFPQDTYSVSVSELAPVGSLLVSVEAVDPDTKPRISYKILEGDTTLFKVAPDTGRVTVSGRLDYETRRTFELIVGTEEGADSVDKASRTLVMIEVEDENDEDPMLMPLHTTTFPRTAPVRTLLVNVSAVDGDGSPPNNLVTFSFIEEGKASEFFNIDSISGEIRLKKSLMETDVSEFMIPITVSDKGSPPRSAFGEFRVLILDEVEPGFSTGTFSTNGESSQSLASSPRFPKDSFQIKVNENIGMGNVILKVPMVNATSLIACSIIEGNDKEMFETMISDDANCKIVTLEDLDYEIDTSYNLTLALHPVGSNIKQDPSSVLSKAFIQIKIMDMNDNSPSFLLENFDILKDYPENTILSYALQSYPVDTKVIELKALDFDSGNLVEYKLLPESNRGNYFSVDAKSGRLYTKRKLINVPVELLPFNLSLVAKDKPGMNGAQHETTINVIIPVIEESQRSILVLDAPKNEVDRKNQFIKKILSESTGKTAQIEQVRQFRKKSRGGMKITSHVWFHLLEPNTRQPVSPVIIRGDKEKSKILDNISKSLDGIKALQLGSPEEIKKKPPKGDNMPTPKVEAEETRLGGILRFNLAENLSTAEYVLLILACVIILFVICSIIAVCILWSKYSKRWNRADKTVMLFQPPLEPAGSMIDAVSKQYEIQVLHMSVPLDDESVPETQTEADSTRHQQYCLDNVSYISKSQTGREGSSSNNSSGPATPRTFDRNGTSGGVPRWSPDTPMMIGYDPYSGNIDASPYNASSSNVNVTFGKRNFPEPSPVETTTEL